MMLSVCSISGFAVNADYFTATPQTENIELENDFSLAFKKVFRQVFNNFFEMLRFHKALSVTEVELNKNNVTIEEDSYVSLKATVEPSKAPNKTIHWKSADSEIATVSNTGNVVGKKTGKTTIYAVADDGGFYDKCIVTVTPKPTVEIPCAQLTLNAEKIEMYVNTESNSFPVYSVDYKITPTDTTDKLTVKSSDSKVATAEIEYGEVHIVGKGKGAAIITVSCGNISRNINVNVNEYGCTWKYDENTATLTVSGYGVLTTTAVVRDNIRTEHSPWKNIIENVKHIIVEEGFTRIDRDVFDDTRVLENISIPSSCESIGRNFIGRGEIEKLVLPEGLVTIEEDALLFSDVQSLCIPSTVTEIESPGTLNIDDEIVVDKNNEYYSSENGVLFNKTKTELLAFPCDYKQAEYVIPDTVTTIGERGMFDTGALKTLYISGNTSTISKDCFLVSSIEEVHFGETTSPKNSNGVYLGSLSSKKNIKFFVDDNNLHFASPDGYALYNKELTVLYALAMKNVFDDYNEYYILDGTQKIGEDALYSTVDAHFEAFSNPDGTLNVETKRIHIPQSVTNHNELRFYHAFDYNVGYGVSESGITGTELPLVNDDYALITFVVPISITNENYEVTYSLHTCDFFHKNLIVKAGTKFDSLKFMNFKILQAYNLELVNSKTEFVAEGGKHYYVPVTTADLYEPSVISLKGNDGTITTTFMSSELRYTYLKYYPEAIYPYIYEMLKFSPEFESLIYSEELIKAIITDVNIYNNTSSLSPLNDGSYISVSYDLSKLNVGKVQVSVYETSPEPNIITLAFAEGTHIHAGYIAEILSSKYNIEALVDACDCVIEKDGIYSVNAYA